MAEDSSTYDARESGEAVTMEDVSLMPNWLGFNAVWAMVLIVVCILLLAPSVVVINVFPWQFGVVSILLTLAFDALLLVVALLAAILTPSHEGTWKYMKSRWSEFRGRKLIRSDSRLPSRRGRRRN